MFHAEPKPDLCNCLALRKAARHVSQLYDRCLAPTGLRVTQFSILARLHRQGPQTMGELAAQLVLDRTTLTRNLRPLARDKLVAVRNDPRDGRRRALSITAHGTERLRVAAPLWTTAQKRFEHAYGGTDSLALRGVLAKIANLDLAAG